MVMYVYESAHFNVFTFRGQKSLLGFFFYFLYLISETGSLAEGEPYQ